jgi:undecaprenyl-diphosphatase
MPSREYPSYGAALTSPRILLAMLLVVGAGWIFVQIIDEVREGDSKRFDDRMLLALRQPGKPSQPIGPLWLHEVGRDATALGGVLCIVLITTFVAGFLLLEGKRHAAIFLIIAVGGGSILSGVLKHLVSRDRPDIVPHLSAVYTSSFPSGHSMLSAVAYLTLGSLVARVTPRRRTRFFVLFAAMFMTFLVGISRVYMGVHYPTDVLGGWAAGFTWALLCWIVATVLQSKGAIEPDESPEHEGAL